MKATMRFSLKAGERIFINGAVLTVNQKVMLSLLNDARFLLESHVLQVEDATTPTRQLYFVAQALLISPATTEQTMIMFRQLLASLLALHADHEVTEALRAVGELVETGRTFEALKMIRGLFEIDDLKVGTDRTASHQAA
ncbi:flagellar biosynthesis repressor FlbT [Microvirga brassicacearum]|uniref:Flagellar biosynthesis repressor FlbT n=1 Tax=Microvirga brassicacearum TaxID=2580413 RepID=A0A5N3P3K7_9HYPH|nr:flagellar biosynthesis repressor FlbT [Microvirga brassicacearum]